MTRRPPVYVHEKGLLATLDGQGCEGLYEGFWAAIEPWVRAQLLEAIEMAAPDCTPARQPSIETFLEEEFGLRVVFERASGKAAGALNATLVDGIMRGIGYGVAVVYEFIPAEDLDRPFEAVCDNPAHVSLDLAVLHDQSFLTSLTPLVQALQEDAKPMA